MGDLSDRFLLMHPLKQRSRGWQAEVARRVGVSPPTVSDWISGKIKKIEWAHAVKVADLYGFNAIWVASGEGPMRASEPPPPPNGFADRHEVSESDWALLQSVKMLPAKEVEAIRARAKEIAELYERWEREKVRPK
jgi:transcriptional regulator with XRE-family HTH domain